MPGKLPQLNLTVILWRNCSALCQAFSRCIILPISASAPAMSQKAFYCRASVTIYGNPIWGEGKTLPREYIQSPSSGRLHQKDYETLENAASWILPIFRKNRSLWSVLRHLGDIHPETPFADALEYLRRTADGSYRGSLDEMIALLFP